MDELLQLLNTFLVQVQENFDDLSDEEAAEITRFLSEVTGFISEQERQTGGGGLRPSFPQGADLLWILAGTDPQAFTQYLQNFPDPALNALARNPQRLAQVIEQLQRTVTISAGESEDGIARAPLQSSNIYGFRYDPRSGKLLVRFQSGSVYGYTGVPAQVFKIFQQGAIPAKTTGSNRHGQWWTGKMPSLGAAFYELIRQGGYPYQRIS